ncbi:hypothetical protein [Acidicapsa ligni]|uniref:hypothetical protein n=1 Tax=Acidicapsa ligni TaxID=542300 RepID=UPI0021DF4377|nr:hypothetical protein [Acidicapsa ligni]
MSSRIPNKRELNDLESQAKIDSEEDSGPNLIILYSLLALALLAAIAFAAMIVWPFYVRR